MTEAETELAPRRTRRFVWPAEYYSGQTPAPVIPGWAALGCGAAAVVVLLLVFAGGAWMASGGFQQVMDLSLGMTVAEMKGMYVSEVTSVQRKTLDAEIETMREGLRTKKVAVASLQPFMQALQKAVRDEKITPAEAKSLEDTVRRINRLSSKPTISLPDGGNSV
jgi:hypothetical protein